MEEKRITTMTKKKNHHPFFEYIASLNPITTAYITELICIGKRRVCSELTFHIRSIDSLVNVTSPFVFPLLDDEFAQVCA